MNSNLKSVLFFILGLFAGLLCMYLFTTYTIEKRTSTPVIATASVETGSFDEGASSEAKPQLEKNQSRDGSQQGIDALTREDIVIQYVKENKKLPAYYVTKSQAKRQGWEASKGNLCDVLPGKAIGGDRFSNREGNLPQGVQYYEADVNYSCGRRNADRIIFTDNGEVYLTKNHYKSFNKM